MANFVANFFCLGKRLVDDFGVFWRDNRRLFKETAGFVAGAEKGFDMLPQGGIARASFVKISRALRLWQPPDGTKDLQLAIGWRGHGVVVHLAITVHCSMRKTRTKGAG